VKPAEVWRPAKACCAIPTAFKTPSEASLHVRRRGLRFRILTFVEVKE
jgi:hypothetical protein